ncbi:MAG: hypothetical protein ACRD4Y_00225 [Candidatus Acidiferrales bacterium]
MRILESFPINVIVSSDIKQAEEYLRREPVELIFCDEFLPDGTFRELLRSKGGWKNCPPIVPIFHMGEWAEYLEALELGAFEVISYPYHPTDVELSILHAMRSEAPRAESLLYREAS